MYHFKIVDSFEGPSLVIFTGGYEESIKGFGSSLDEIFKLYSEKFYRVFLIFPDFCSDFFDSCIRDDSFKIDVSRLDGVPVDYYKFNRYGELSPFSLDDKKIDITPASLLKVVVRSGIGCLVLNRVDKVILKAPPGSIFKKPSGDNYREFIKTSELAIGSAENRFVAFCLLSKQPRIDIKNIWTDTSGISSVISEICFYLKSFQGESRALKYHSFQSYGGYKKSEPANKSDVWVIISASSSNNLGCQIFKEWKGMRHEQILTILSYKDTVYDVDNDPVRIGDEILLNISEYSEESIDLDKFGDEIPVQVVGENFTVQIESPNSVLLRKPHSPREVGQFIRPLVETNVIECYKSLDNKLYEIFFDIEQYFNCVSDKEINYLKDWLKKCYQWYVPKDIKFLICGSDVQSKFFCKIFVDLLELGGKVQVVNADDIISEVDNTGSVLVVDPVISSGRKLLRINRDLRIVEHDKQRIFIVPFCIFNSGKDFDLFSKSLTLGPSGLKYQFLNYRKIYTGADCRSLSWEAELKVLESLDSIIFKNRAKVIRNRSIGIDRKIGLSLNPEIPFLQFEKDFAFWEPGYKSDNVNPCTVYMTILSILQNLRETPYSLRNKESLYRHLYQRSVLDPENFSRFNDALIQSALWRCATSNEVDYSDHGLSKEISDIVLRLARDASADECNVTADILIGIAVGKIKIDKKFLENLLDSMQKILPDKEEIIELIQYIKCVVIEGKSFSGEEIL